MKDLKTTSAGVGLILSGVMWFLHLINPEVAGPDLGTRTIREKMKELGLVAQTGKRGNVRVVR